MKDKTARPEDFTAAEAALSWLRARGLMPDPTAYAVAYAAVTDACPPLADALAAAEATGDRLDAALMRGLHAEHLVPDGDPMHDISDAFQGEISTVMKAMQAAGQDASAYGKTLAAVSGQLGRQQGLGETRAMVESLATATKVMEAKSRSLETRLKNSSEEIRILRSRLEAARQETLTDALTGIANRKAFDENLSAAYAEANREGEKLTLLMADIDFFKRFNDTWGHQTGDQVLKLVAHCLRENTKGRDTAARYGGEEFAVVLPHTGLEQAIMLAEQIRGGVEGKTLLKKSTGENLGTITISLGAAELKKGERIADLIARADACLYAAKRKGRNQVVGEDDVAAEDLAASAEKRSAKRAA